MPAGGPPSRCAMLCLPRREGRIALPVSSPQPQPQPKPPPRRRPVYIALIAFLLLLLAVLHLHHTGYRFDPLRTLRFDQRPLPPPLDDTFLSSPNYTLPLRTQGRDIVDAHGRRFRLASVNWYGGSDHEFVPGGLGVRHRDDIARTIRRLGFNSVRLPYSDELVMRDPLVLPHLLAANRDLIGRRALGVYEAVVEALTRQGIAVVVNNHITSATWCCGADPCDAGWANDHLPPVMCRVRQTEEEWIEHWETVMGRFVNNSLVVAADLRNEVRGLWGTMPWERWAAAAEKAGNRLLKMRPDWLIIVGGTESQNDLSGVARRPVVLDVPDRVVYSAHVYKWSGWGSPGGRYETRTYESFVRSVHRNWGYLLEEKTAAVWVGEFGAPRSPMEGDTNYWNNLLRYLKAIDADFGYWALNPRKGQNDDRDWYSLVQDDWATPILDYRMEDLTELIGAGR